MLRATRTYYLVTVSRPQRNPGELAAINLCYRHQKMAEDTKSKYDEAGSTVWMVPVVVVVVVMQILCTYLKVVMTHLEMELNKIPLRQLSKLAAQY